jgi:hypothetical protein
MEVVLTGSRTEYIDWTNERRMALDMRGLMGVGSVGLMAARPHDRKGRRMRGEFRSSRRPKCTAPACLFGAAEPKTRQFWHSIALGSYWRSFLSLLDVSSWTWTKDQTRLLSMDWGKDGEPSMAMTKVWEIRQSHRLYHVVVESFVNLRFGALDIRGLRKMEQQRWGRAKVYY